MYIKKFYDMEASDDSSGSTEMTETAPSETMSIAALMAREGVKSDSERTDFNPVHVNRDGTWETKREDVDSSVAPTTEETDSEETQRESSQSFEEEDVPTTQKEEGAYEYQEWQDAVKVQRPEEVLKVLGFDDKTTSFIKELQGVDSKLIGLLNTWKEGGDLKAYFEEQSKDYSTMPAEDVMRHQLRVEYPKATDAQIDVLFKKDILEKYGLNSFDEDEVAEGKLLLEAKAEKYRDGLIQSQQERLIPPTPKQDDSRIAQQQLADQFSQKIVSDFNNDPYTREVMSKNAITIGEGADKFSFPIDGKSISDLALNGDVTGELLFNKKVGADGLDVYTPKSQHQILVATVNKYGDKFITELAKHYKSLGSKAAIEPIDNARPSESRNSSNASVEPTTIVGAMAKFGRMNSGG